MSKVTDALDRAIEKLIQMVADRNDDIQATKTNYHPQGDYCENCRADINGYIAEIAEHEQDIAILEQVKEKWND